MRRLVAGVALTLALLSPAFQSAIAREAAALAAETAAPLISYTSEDESPTLHQATLYFRYRDTGFLGQEERLLAVPRTESFALALIRALVDGPASLSPHLTPLFPPATAVLGVQQEGLLFFVTFNEAVMGRYADESTFLLSLLDYRQAEGLLRRRLAMSALVNTLTENLPCGTVQVLVRAETYISTSMRLSDRYYLKDSDTLPDPLVRDEASILTPSAAAQLVLDAWAKEGWDAAAALTDPVTEQPKQLPYDHGASDAEETAPVLSAYTVTPGSISPDGHQVIVCVDGEFLTPSGSSRHIRSFPLRLVRRQGVWFASHDSLLLLAELAL